MKLQKKLEALGTAQVSIGTKDGSGWIYIGPANEFEGINKAFEESLEEVKRNLERNRLDVLGIMSRVMNGKTNNATPMDIANSIHMAYRKYDANRIAINNFKPATERAIVDCYERSTDGVEYAIHIVGTETGVWTRNELNEKSSNLD